MVNNFVKYIGYTLLGALAYATFLPYVEATYRVKPYTDVVIHTDDWTKDGLTVRGSFTKNGECTIVSFAVVSFSDGIPRYVDYEDLDGLEKDFDREAGRQGLNIFLPVSPLDSDRIETRTRHSCIVGTDEDGKDITRVINKVFSTHEPN